MQGDRTIKITQSQVKSFVNCRKKFYFEYIELLKPLATQKALEIGRCLHDSVEKDKDSIDPISQAMYLAYKKYVNIPILKHEVLFEYKIGYGVILTGKLDGLTSDSVFELKSASKVDDEYFYNLQKNVQVSSYLLSQGLNRMTYCVIQKPSIRQKQNESIEEFNQRLIAYYEDTVINYNKIFIRTERRTKEDIEECKKELHQIAREIRSCKTFYKNPAACSIFPCSYSSICLNYQPKQIPFGYERKEAKNEELM